MSDLLAEVGQVQLAADYGICVAGTLFIYDYVLTFHQERALVWTSKWSYGKALFLFIRYTGFLVLGAFFIVEYTTPISQPTCTGLIFLCLALNAAVTLCAGLVLALRTWALWNRNRICGAFIGVAWCSVTVLVLTFLVISNISLKPAVGDGAFPDVIGCGAIISPASAAADLKLVICLATYESVILIMTIFRGLRYLYNPAPLMLVLFRDAFLASICLLTLTVTDAIVSSMASPHFYIVWMISVAFYFITPCRIILNLREATRHVDGWDLATTRAQSTEDEVTASDATGWS